MKASSHPDCLPYLPYGRHAIGPSDIAAVVQILEGAWLTTGPAVKAFEDALKAALKVPFATACSNGTTALQLALMALGIGPGDRVLVPGVTFLASANAVRQVGAEVTFVDVDPSTGLVTPELLRHAIQGYQGAETLRAFINVHYAGQCEDLEAIAAVARGHGLRIIEDAAHAIGSVYVDAQGQHHPIGSCAFCDLTTFSFHPLKTIATGEGGAITTADPAWAHTVATLRTHGMLRSPQHWVHPDEGLEQDPSSPDPLSHPWYYEMQELGYNFRLSDIACALGSSQVAQLQAFKDERKRWVALYDAALPALGLPSLRRLPSCDPAWHLYVIRPDWTGLKRTRSQQMRRLHALGIGSQVHYMPLYRHPYYVQRYGMQAAQFEGCEKMAARVLSLPLYVGLGPEGVQRVLEALQELVA